MLKRSLILVFLPVLILLSCKGRNAGNDIDTATDVEEKKEEPMPVFPVTDYLEGQINTVREMPVTLLKTINRAGTMDSAWIGRDEIGDLASPFLMPVIDSPFLAKYFRGSSFFDPSTNSVTFSYSTLNRAEPGSVYKDISVYVHPETNKVERVYMEREAGDTSVQLTWKSDQWFSIRKIAGDQVTEEKVTWNF